MLYRLVILLNNFNKKILDDHNLVEMVLSHCSVV